MMFLRCTMKKLLTTIMLCALWGTTTSASNTPLEPTPSSASIHVILDPLDITKLGVKTYTLQPLPKNKDFQSVHSSALGFYRDIPFLFPGILLQGRAVWVPVDGTAQNTIFQALDFLRDHPQLSLILVQAAKKDA